MRATADDQNALSPERRLDAVADILSRGLARVLLAEDTGAGADVAHVAQPAGNTSKGALIDVPSRALMVTSSDDPAAAKGGRNR